MIGMFNRNKAIKIKDYGSITGESKELVDYTIKFSLRENPILRRGRKNLKPKEFDFWRLLWNDIVLLRHYLDIKDVKAVHKLVYGITDKDFLNLNLMNCSACYKWVASKINEINEIEKAELGHQTTAEENGAGVERLNEFGYSVALYQFRGTDISKDKGLLNTQYAKIFKELCMYKTVRDIQEQNRKNASRKT